MKHRAVIVVAVSLCAGVGYSVAQEVVPTVAPAATDATTEAEKRGFWWKRERAPEAEAPKEAEAEPLLGPPPAEEQLAKLKPKDFEKLLNDYLDQALMTLEPQHVAHYYQMQDFARRRSRAFMNVTEMVMLGKPDINMNTVYPVTQAGQTARVAQREASFDARLTQERESAALVLLTSKGCGLCEAQRATVKYFQQRHGWEVREVDIQEQPQAAAKFGTTFTPTTVVIFRNSSEWMPVAVGVESVPRLEESVYRSVRYMRGETSAQQFTVQEFQTGTPLDPRR